MKRFYAQIVEIDSVIAALGTLELSEVEKEELGNLARSHLHQVIVDAILNELSDRDKKIFLANLEYEEEETIWKHLNQKVEKIQEKIISAADDIKNQLYKDIDEVKNSKGTS